MKIKKHFINNFPLTGNSSQSCAVINTRYHKGVHPDSAVKNHPATVSRVITREERSPITNAKAPEEMKRVRFDKRMSPEDKGRLPIN